jgi:hypothetical protein
MTFNHTLTHVQDLCEIQILEKAINNHQKFKLDIVLSLFGTEGDGEKVRFMINFHYDVNIAYYSSDVNIITHIIITHSINLHYLPQLQSPQTKHYQIKKRTKHMHTLTLNINPSTS